MEALLGHPLTTVVLAVFGTMVALMLVVSGPVAHAIGDVLGLGSVPVRIQETAKWPVLLPAAIVAVAVLYDATPNVAHPREEAHLADAGGGHGAVQRVRAGSTVLRTAGDTVVLRRLNILTAAREDAPVTLAGLLTHGVFPQEQFPQLMAFVVVHPPEGDSGAQFLDKVTVRGNIPDGEARLWCSDTPIGSGGHRPHGCSSRSGWRRCLTDGVTTRRPEESAP